jgi:hypothetical protein
MPLCASSFRETDPWKTYTGESVRVEAREAVRALYDMTSTFLANGGGSNFRVDGLFLWNVASWDLLGIHWRSYSNEGAYYEPGVARIVSGWLGCWGVKQLVESSQCVLCMHHRAGPALQSAAPEQLPAPRAARNGGAVSTCAACATPNGPPKRALLPVLPCQSVVSILLAQLALPPAFAADL